MEEIVQQPDLNPNSAGTMIAQTLKHRTVLLGDRSDNEKRWMNLGKPLWCIFAMELVSDISKSAGLQIPEEPAHLAQDLTHKIKAVQERRREHERQERERLEQVKAIRDAKRQISSIGSDSAASAAKRPALERSTSASFDSEAGVRPADKSASAFELQSTAVTSGASVVTSGASAVTSWASAVTSGASTVTPRASASRVSLASSSYSLVASSSSLEVQIGDPSLELPTASSSVESQPASESVESNSKRVRPNLELAPPSSSASSSSLQVQVGDPLHLTASFSAESQPRSEPVDSSSSSDDVQCIDLTTASPRDKVVTAPNLPGRIPQRNAADSQHFPAFPAGTCAVPNKSSHKQNFSLTVLSKAGSVAREHCDSISSAQFREKAVGGTTGTPTRTLTGTSTGKVPLTLTDGRLTGTPPTDRKLTGAGASRAPVNYAQTLEQKRAEMLAKLNKSKPLQNRARKSVVKSRDRPLVKLSAGASPHRKGLAAGRAPISISKSVQSSSSNAARLIFGQNTDTYRPRTSEPESQKRSGAAIHSFYHDPRYPTKHDGMTSRDRQVQRLVQMQLAQKQQKKSTLPTTKKKNPADFSPFRGKQPHAGTATVNNERATAGSASAPHFSMFSMDAILSAQGLKTASSSAVTSQSVSSSGGTTSHMPSSRVTTSHMPSSCGTALNNPSSHGTTSQMPSSRGTTLNIPSSQGTTSHMPSSHGTTSLVLSSRYSIAQQSKAAEALRRMVGQPPVSKGLEKKPSAGGQDNPIELD